MSFELGFERAEFNECASFRSWLASYANFAGIKNFRWHHLRHVWETWHVMAGTTMAELQERGA